MDFYRLLTVDRKKNKKGQTYYTIAFGNDFKIFNTLDEALAEVSNIAKFADSVISLAEKAKQ